MTYFVFGIYAPCGLGPEHAIRMDAMLACRGAMEWPGVPPLELTYLSLRESNLTQTDEDKAMVCPRILAYFEVEGVHRRQL